MNIKILGIGIVTAYLSYINNFWICSLISGLVIGSCIMEVIIEIKAKFGRN